jgi:serine/threonine protein kinase
MKVCPTCQRVYPDDAGFCAADGTALVHASMVPTQTATDDKRLGTRLGDRYELRRVVADGGMGRVYEGIDKFTNSRIAVKVLHDEVVKDEVSLERFKREYEISKSLPHDHIVDVLDFQHDATSGLWFLVMEFLDGEELRVLLKREKTIPPERVVRMLSQVAKGLDEAHKRQFVHRDLKPDNLFMCGTREGDLVKILDFGSVKDKNQNAKKLTVLGTTIGSPYYMAPEQAQGLDTLDGRADVFALGAIAYESLTGSVPFDGSNGPSILLAIMTKDPVPASERLQNAGRSAPMALDEVLEVALAKNPNIRTRTVGDLANALGHAYGLTGVHQAWALTPQAELASQIQVGLSRPVQRASAPVAALESAPDPFAAPAPAHGAPAPDARASARQMDRAFEAIRQHEVGDDEPLVAFGVPSRRPSWLVPVIVGVVAILVGGVATFFFAAGH